MALPNPEKLPFDQVLKLVEQLSLNERKALRQKLNNEQWGAEWEALVTEVRERNKHLPPLTEEEIFAAMKEEPKS
jgi:hypothetical protein